MSGEVDYKQLRNASLATIINAYRSAGKEFLQDEQAYRLSAFPIPDVERDLHKFYVEQRAAFWREDDFTSEYVKDIVAYPNLDPDIKHIAVFSVKTFNVGDGVTNIILKDAIKPNITNRGFDILCNYVEAIEDIHNLTYSKLGEIYKEPTENIHDAYDVYHNVPIIKRRIDWLLSELGMDMSDIEKGRNVPIPPDVKLAIKDMLNSMPLELRNKYADIEHRINLPEITLAKRLAINAFNEGVGFMSVFAAIFWMKTKNVCPALVKANEYISRDENAHRNNTVYIYKNLLTHKMSTEEIHGLYSRGLEIEREFVKQLLPKRLSGINADMMIEYVEVVTNQLLIDMGYPALFANRTNPFSFMKMQSIGVRSTDFFADPSVTEYSDGNRKSASNVVDLNSDEF